jgi:molybdopterin converting factor small subunit
LNKVTVKYRGHIANIVGASEDTFESENVEGVLKLIRERHGKKAEKTARSSLIALNGKSILLLKLYQTTLKEGDIINFFPISAGG